MYNETPSRKRKPGNERPKQINDPDHSFRCSVSAHVRLRAQRSLATH
jgi:hypothetical protein